MILCSRIIINVIIRLCLGDYSGRLRPAGPNKSFIVSMYSFQKRWLKTSTRDDKW